MSEIPTISITDDSNGRVSDDDADSDENDMDYGNAGGHTDVEDMDSCNEDDDQPNLIRKLKKHSNKVSPAVTDVEDYNDSDSEDEKSDAYPELKLSLQEFLDQGFTQEEVCVDGDVVKSGMKGIPGKFATTLGQDDDAGCVTDCEAYNTSDDESWDDKPVASIAEDLEAHLPEPDKLEITDAVAKHRGVYKLSDADDDEVSCNDLSDISEDSEGACGGVSEVEDLNLSAAPAVEIQMQDSSDDIESDPEYPPIDVTFISVNEPLRKTKDGKISPSYLGLPKSTDDPLTDVEKLDSSAGEDSSSEDGKAIPAARATISARSSITDEENVDLSDIGGRRNSVAIVCSEAVPPPHRELVMITEDETGGPKVTVEALDENFPRGIYNNYADEGNTDCEDIMDDDFDLSEARDISTASDAIVLENEIVKNSEMFKVTTPVKRVELTNCEPVTDVEELFMAGTVRRKKTKSKVSQAKSKSKSSHLEVKPAGDDGGTDIEEIDLSDAEGVLGLPFKEETKPTPPEEFVTEVEYVTGEEDVSDVSDVDPQAVDPSLVLDSYCSAVTSLDTFSNEEEQASRTFRVSPIMLMAQQQKNRDQQVVQCPTDVEDFQLHSDVEDKPMKTIPSRADNVSPYEMREFLNDSRSVVHEKCRSAFDMDKERQHIKGMNNSSDVHTDVEYVEEELAREALEDEKQPSERKIVQVDERHIFDSPEKHEGGVDDNHADQGQTNDYPDMDYIRNEAKILIDSVLEESVLIVNAHHQHECSNNNNNNDGNTLAIENLVIDTYNSESENYAITCDVNGVDMVKSPTIESMSGKSFDDNLSVNDDNNYVILPTTATPCFSTLSNVSNHPTTPSSPTTSASRIQNVTEASSIQTNTPITTTTIVGSEQKDNEQSISLISSESVRRIQTDSSLLVDFEPVIIGSSSRVSEIDDDVAKNKKLKRIEKKFERLSSQVDDVDEIAVKFDQDIDSFVSKDEISNLQGDFSKISWDESVSGTTTTAADVGLSTPDNDLQDLPTAGEEDTGAEKPLDDQQKK